MGHEETGRATREIDPALAGVVNSSSMRDRTNPLTGSEPLYVDEQELSRLTTLSRTTLQTMRKNGQGPKFAKLGHRIVYRFADVERWIQERMR